jgi:hypothetical protein
LGSEMLRQGAQLSTLDDHERRSGERGGRGASPLRTLGMNAPNTSESSGDNASTLQMIASINSVALSKSHSSGSRTGRGRCGARGG